MDDLKTDSLVREHYENHAMPQERLDELGRLVQEHRAPPRRRRSDLISILAAAACLVLAVAVLLFVVRRPAVANPALTGMPRIVAVQFHADWCKPSREISPRVDDLRMRYGDDGVLFVEVDLTTEQTRHQAGYLMTALGLDEVWKQQNGRTGELLLVDRIEGRVLTTLDHQDELPLMTAALDRVLDPS